MMKEGITRQGYKGILVLGYIQRSCYSSIRTQNKLFVFSEADWRKSEQGRSQSEGVVTFCGNIISWNFRKQSSVALSTTKVS